MKDTHGEEYRQLGLNIAYYRKKTRLFTRKTCRDYRY